MARGLWLPGTPPLLFSLAAWSKGVIRPTWGPLASRSLLPGRSQAGGPRRDSSQGLWMGRSGLGWPLPNSFLSAWVLFHINFFFSFFFLSTNLCNGPCSYLLIKKSRSLQACCSGPPGVDLAWAPALTTRFPTPFTSEATGGAQKQVRRRQNIQPLRSNLWFPKADSFLHSRPPLPGPGLGHFP